jgi:hypothetical protein
MAVNETNEPSLLTWLDQVYLPCLKGLEYAICEDRGSASAQSTPVVDFFPIAPIKIDACFINTLYRQYVLEMAGGFYTTIELVVDFTTKRVIAAYIFIPVQGTFLHVNKVPIDMIQGNGISSILQSTMSAKDLSIESLDALLTSVKSVIDNVTSADHETIPSIDSIRIIDARVFEQLALAGGDPTASSTMRGASLEALFDAMKKWLDFHVDGMIRSHPVQDKLSSFLVKVATMMHDASTSEIMPLLAQFLPKGNLVIVAYTGDAITALRAEKSASGQVLLKPLNIPFTVASVSPGPGNFDAMGRALKKDANADVVLFLSVDALAEACTNFMDSILAKDHDVNGPGIVQVTLESLLLYLRTFKQTWYALPKPMLFKLFGRFLLRFNKLHLDLPRLLHDRIANMAVHLIQDNFGSDFTLIACLLFKEKEIMSLRALMIEIKGLVPRRITPVDPALLQGIDSHVMDASMIAQAIHEKAIVALSASSIHVIVLTPRFTATIASAMRTLFKRVAVNPFALTNVVKAFKNGKSFGLYPVPAGIETIISKKPVAILRALSTKGFLKY